MPQSLFRSFRAAPSKGEALPMPYKALADEGIAFRKGQVAIVGAAPGKGKTAFLLNWLVSNPVRQNVGVLYLSPDSDIMTIGPRLIASMQNRPVRTVFAEFDAQGERAAENMEYVKSLNHVSWCFDSSLTYVDVEEEVKAYEAVYGRFPDVIVLDNITDIHAEGEEFTRDLETVKFFYDVAATTGASCVLLHHLTREYEDGTKPPTLGALKGAIGKKPRLVLNLFEEFDNTLSVLVAKNSNGKSNIQIDLSWDKITQVIR